MNFKKLTLVTLFIVNILFLLPSSLIQAQTKELPSYVKWGRIAMAKTQEAYPDSEITDYLHVGKEENKGKSTEKFKLIVKKDEKEIGVFVHLTFDSRTEKLLSVDLKESKP